MEDYLAQRAKFKYCFFVSIITTALIFLSTFLRLNVNFDTFDKEERVSLNFEKMKKHYGKAAEHDSREHNISQEQVEEQQIPKDYAKIL